MIKGNTRSLDCSSYKIHRNLEEGYWGYIKAFFKGTRLRTTQQEVSLRKGNWVITTPG